MSPAKSPHGTFTTLGGDDGGGVHTGAHHRQTCRGGGGSGSGGRISGDSPSNRARDNEFVLVSPKDTADVGSSAALPGSPAAVAAGLSSPKINVGPGQAVLDSVDENAFTSHGVGGGGSGGGGGGSGSGASASLARESTVRRRILSIPVGEDGIIENYYTSSATAAASTPPPPSTQRSPDANAEQEQQQQRQEQQQEEEKRQGQGQGQGQMQGQGQPLPQPPPLASEQQPPPPPRRMRRSLQLRGKLPPAPRIIVAGRVLPVAAGVGVSVVDDPSRSTSMARATSSTATRYTSPEAAATEAIHTQPYVIIILHPTPSSFNPEPPNTEP